MVKTSERKESKRVVREREISAIRARSLRETTVEPFFPLQYDGFKTKPRYSHLRRVTPFELG